MQIDSSGTGTAYQPWYLGPAEQSFVSGVPDGTVLVRVRTKSAAGVSPWSPPARIRVEHHSFTKAFTLLSLGFVVFMIIATYIGINAMRTEPSA